MDTPAYTIHVTVCCLIFVVQASNNNSIQTTTYIIQLLHYRCVLLAGKTLHDNLQIACHDDQALLHPYFDL